MVFLVLSPAARRFPKCEGFAANQEGETRVERWIHYDRIDRYTVLGYQRNSYRSRLCAHLAAGKRGRRLAVLQARPENRAIRRGGRRLDQAAISGSRHDNRAAQVPCPVADDVTADPSASIEFPMRLLTIPTDL